MPRSSRTLWTAKLTGKRTPEVSADSPYLSGPPSFRGIILGVDPSLRGTGFAVVDFSKGVEQGRCMASQTLKLKPALPMPACLGAIAQTVTQLIAAHQPDCVVLEQTIYVQNFQTAQVLGAARGAAIAPAAMCSLDIYEYAPLRIKQAVVGFGRASKEQVVAMVRQLLRMPQDLPKDEADAAAVALCHALTNRSAK